MKRLLIVEDNKHKAIAVQDAIISAFPDSEVVMAETVVIAMVLLNTQNWDGVVLDLAFQQTRGAKQETDRPQLAGVKVMQQMNERRSSTPVIIATQHSSFVDTEFGDFASAKELGDLLSQAFPDNFVGLVEVDLSSIAWQRLLRNLALEAF